MQPRWAVAGLLALSLFMSFSAMPAAAKRVALVIGNSAYEHTGKLPNPRNDAADMAAALKTLGFEVIDGVDLDKAAMDRKLRDFARALPGADTALFFYAGHGLQVGGQNYLLPIDAKLEDASGLDFEAVRLDLVHRTMEREVPTNVVFLDACRDNPLARNLARALGTRSTQIGKGLAAVEAGSGTLISFSTQPGNVAFDGEGRNSPFAGSLLKQVATPGEDLSSMLINVRNEVMQVTRNRQVPWEHSALRTKLYLSPPKAQDAPQAALPPGLTYEQQSELAFWNAVKDSGDARTIETYLDRFPNGTFSGLARVMVERLKAQGTKTAALTAPPERAQVIETNQESLARDLQKELARVGCDPGTVDGQWGSKARTALREFAKRTRTALAAEEPSRAALDAVLGQHERVCPLRCARGESEVGGKCVAKSPRPAKAVAKQPKSRSTGVGSAQQPQGNVLKDSSLCDRWRSGDPRARGWDAYCR